MLYMKKCLVLIVFLLSLTLLKAQVVVVRDSSGNYIPLTQPHAKVVSVFTGKYYITGGKWYPVFKTSTNKLFIMRTSQKTAKVYKVYLKLDSL
jgi:hypothetical protein